MDESPFRSLFLNYNHMRKDLQFKQYLIAFILITGSFTQIIAQLNYKVYVAPMDCYNFASASAMDAAAAQNNTNQPFATWKGAYDFAVLHGINTIEFAAGTYLTDLSGQSTDWGSANTGFVLAPGMTVNGNGAVIDNTPNAGSGNLAFAALATNATIDGFTFIKFTGTAGGAISVPSSADDWLISNCDFFNCNLGTDAVPVNMAGSMLNPTVGNITGCNFYGNSNPNATFPQSPGLPSSSAMAVTGDLFSTLNITNTTFSCNFRNVSGGAIQIHSATNVNFEGCTFYRNEANASVGGAISIRNGAQVSFNNTNFIDNFATAASSADVGAISIESGSDVTITNCVFKGNSSPDDCGAIAVSGSSNNSSVVEISNTVFDGNSANDEGGALYVDSYADVTVTECLFINNTSGDKGSAIWVNVTTSTKTLELNNCTLTNNTPGSGEACIHVGYADTNTNVSINDCIVSGNGSSSEEDLESEYITALTFLTNTKYRYKKGTFDESGGGNMANYIPNFNSNYVDENNTVNNIFGWTGSYIPPVSSGTCPSPTSFGNDCSNQGSISGIAFEDVNGDGIYDPSIDLLLAGVQVIAYLNTNNGASAEIPTAITVTTAADGSYFIGGLESGETYTLEFIAPNGQSYFITSQNASNSVASNDSDVIETNGFTGDITINTSTNNISTNDETTGFAHYENVDVGFSQPIVIEGTIYVDLDGDGTGETPYTGGDAIITVTMAGLDGDCGTADDATSSLSLGDFVDTSSPTDGTYSISIPPGIVCTVEVTFPEGTTAVNPITGTTLQLNNITITGADLCPLCTTASATGAMIPSGTLNLTNNNFALPVDFVSIKAKNEDCQVRITWVTAVELDNSHFVIERSTDANEYLEIGNLKGAGNSSRTNQYEFVDQEKSNATYSYYRIKQVDYDGKYSYSDVVSVRNNNCDGALTYSRVYPTVFDNSIQYEIGTPSTDNISLQIFNIQGQLIQQVSIDNSAKGVVTGTLTLDGLKSGIYFIHTSADAEVHKVIKI